MRSATDMAVKPASIYHLAIPARNGAERPKESHISLAPVIVTAEAAIAAGIVDF